MGNTAQRDSNQVDIMQMRGCSGAVACDVRAPVFETGSMDARLQPFMTEQDYVNVLEDVNEVLRREGPTMKIYLVAMACLLAGAIGRVPNSALRQAFAGALTSSWVFYGSIVIQVLGALMLLWATYTMQCGLQRSINPVLEPWRQRGLTAKYRGGSRHFQARISVWLPLASA